MLVCSWGDDPVCGVRGKSTLFAAMDIRSYLVCWESGSVKVKKKLNFQRPANIGKRMVEHKAMSGRLLLDLSLSLALASLLHSALRASALPLAHTLCARGWVSNLYVVPSSFRKEGESVVALSVVAAAAPDAKSHRARTYIYKRMAIL